MIQRPLSISDPKFWHQPLSARMAHFAEMRERDRFSRHTFIDPLIDEEREFFAATRYDDVVEISRRPLEFCSGQGSTSINDLPADAMEFFGSFIVMDDPRHARQRGIVARAFTPRHLQGLLDSVEQTCTEVIDDICERGEVDLVQAVSQPFPLLVICDMMGIPRSEFSTVLRATNVILGAGDPDMLEGREDVLAALLEAGMQLTNLMNELAEHRRKHPGDDLTTALVHNDLGEDMLAPSELAPFFILLAVAGNDTTRTAISLGMHLLAENPDQRAIWQADLAGTTATAVEEIVRAAAPVVFMRRTATRDVTLSGHAFHEGDKVVLFYGAANRDPRVFDDPERFDVRRDPNPHLGFGGPGPHFCLGAHLARRELSVVFRQLLTRLPDIEVAGDPVPLQSLGIPLVGGIKHLPVRFTPTARSRPR
ncbi:MAG TPA: cytochrome P450 [Candidatus Dormibacteraeota bacterium]